MRSFVWPCTTYIFFIHMWVRRLWLEGATTAFPSGHFTLLFSPHQPALSIGRVRDLPPTHNHEWGRHPFHTTPFLSHSREAVEVTGPLLSPSHPLAELHISHKAKLIKIPRPPSWILLTLTQTDIVTVFHPDSWKSSKAINWWHRGRVKANFWAFDFNSLSPSEPQEIRYRDKGRPKPVTWAISLASVLWHPFLLFVVFFKSLFLLFLALFPALFLPLHFPASIQELFKNRLQRKTNSPRPSLVELPHEGREPRREGKKKQ